MRNRKTVAKLRISSLFKLIIKAVCIMGFSFRKIINLGLFRINLSKSGVSFSTGVKGARVSTGPRGTYVHFGSKGFRYSQRIDNSSKSTNQRFSEVKNSELYNQIKSNAEQTLNSVIKILLILIISSVLLSWLLLSFFNLSAGLLLLILLINAFCLTYLVHKIDKNKRTTHLVYDIQGEAYNRYKGIRKAFVRLSKAQAVWINFHVPANVLQEDPPLISTNIDVWCLYSNSMSLYFLPDVIYIKQGRDYYFIDYKSISLSFKVETTATRTVPSDSIIVDYMYEHSRVDGGPDRRYKHNPQIPIVNYGVLKFHSENDWNFRLQVSNLQIAEDFYHIFNREVQGKILKKTANTSNQQSKTHQSKGSKQQKQNQSAHQENPTKTNVVANALKVLGVNSNADRTEIISSYRNLVKSYHPDRATQTTPEIANLAAEKFKEINEAFKILKKEGIV